MQSTAALMSLDTQGLELQPSLYRTGVCVYVCVCVSQCTQRPYLTSTSHTTPLPSAGEAPQHGHSGAALPEQGSSC